MSEPSSPAGIETTGIEIIAESERTAKPRNLFLPWFASNISVFGMSYGAFVLGFGISFWQATVATLIGVVVSFAFCGVIAIAGKRGSAPTMVASRAAFGVQGNKVPGIVSWITSIGWETSLAITAVLATATVFARLGWSSGTGVKIIAAIVVALLIVAGAVAGYHIIMKMQSVLTWVTGIVTIVYLAMALPAIRWDAVMAIPSGSWQSVVGALTMVMTGMGLGWVNIAADWSRYQSREASGGSIVFWNTFGGSLGPVFLITAGLLLAGSSQTLSKGVEADPVGALASILPTWFLVPFLIVAILSLLSGAINGIYSSGLTLLSLGIRIPRPAASLIDGTILTIGTIYVVFFSPNFISPFQSFLVTLGVPLAAWAGIMMADIAVRRKPYDDADLFRSAGRYGAVDWTSLITLVITTVIGWGLVINQYEGVSWNNWQGYLLGPLGLGGREGDWAWANIGVIAALVLAFVVTLVARRSRVRVQEAPDA
ncbi:MAG: cytosine permease [Acidipropionibacterium acidipropionici]|uniref:Allantoin permease n=1 Tax=Acidipropionibacterium acidipropionici TaxID=1748 RepID=A0A142KMG4_9ACTN|nr:cytosine permease [Acidipropionibacterium acidipropionici]ALN17022.1 allantoin permease [Acidipropionibacterium acidipropionici]AMS07302.1 allantoin permease [Acidipropionibacterium acidipropionici]AOZ45451.1 allantoin permease [Acidipropionibacterium acidipropionici]APZ11070.1 allantoin permease [Acidipropionibacterium acidipropionici]AZP38541.1 allantoin permease [Acidipropionibacterium acidipropionici]